jgi:GT2 family glycosyltransferase
MSARVSIIVLCYNSIDLTLTCLESLHRQTYPDFDILVVDNASQDGTPDAIRAVHPDISLISTGDNLGYAGGNNVGIRAALRRGADAIFLVNNDTLLDPDCVTALVKALEANPRIGIVGPMIYTWEQGHTISSAGGEIDWQHADSINVGAGEIDHDQYPARSVDFANGCGLMITRAAIERAGLLDPRYFMYWEETDWCQRVQRAGMEIRFEPGARMQHKTVFETERLGPTTLYYVTRNRLLFFARHTRWPSRPLTLARALHGALRGVALHRQANRPAHARATRLAIRHALERRWGYVDPMLWLADDSRLDSAAPGSGRLA